MEKHPPDRPVGDPFFAAVRRRHPDVDIVLLPPEPRPAGPALGEDEVGGAADRVAAVAADLTDGLPSPEAVLERRMRYGPAPATVEATARRGGRSPEGYAALLALRARLEDAGWEVGRPAGAAAELLEARRDDLVVTASYAEATGLLAVTVSTVPLRVADRAAARRLVRGNRERT